MLQAPDQALALHPAAVIVNTQVMSHLEGASTDTSGRTGAAAAVAVMLTASHI